MNDINDFIIEDGVLVRYTGKDTEVMIPDTVTSIGEGAFMRCFGVVSVNIPASVTHIGNGAFKFCDSLKSVCFEGSSVRIEKGAFYECNALADKNGFIIVGGVLCDYYGDAADVKIPDTVKEISDSAFFAKFNITGVVIPDSVEIIGSGAFYGCVNLCDITVPASVTSVDDEAFMTHGEVFETPEFTVSDEDKKNRSFKRVTLHVPEGSYAEEYAKLNNIKYSISD